MTAEKRLLKDIERAYRITKSDINSYIRQTGTITVEAAKRLIRWNYFKNTNVAKIWTYEDEGVNNFIITMDMFDLHLWIIENYGADIDIIENIEEELNYLTTFYINKP